MSRLIGIIALLVIIGCEQEKVTVPPKPKVRSINTKTIPSTENAKAKILTRWSEIKAKE